MIFSNGVKFKKIFNSSYFLIEDPIYIINCTVQKVAFGAYLIYNIL